MRLIDADALIEFCAERWIPLNIDAVNMQPTAQPEPHEGHWIGGDGSYICSECNSSPLDFIETMGSSFDAYVETLMNFCPNCGADMRPKEGDT